MNKKNKKAFSLIEIVISTFIIGLSVTGIYFTHLTMSKEDHKTNYGLQAEYFSSYIYEILKNAEIPRELGIGNNFYVNMVNNNTYRFSIDENFKNDGIGFFPKGNNYSHELTYMKSKKINGNTHKVYKIVTEVNKIKKEIYIVK